MNPRRRRGRRIHPVATALLTLALVVAVTYYAFSRSVPFVHEFTLHALVDNAVGVRADAPVRIAGVDVGAVQGVSADGALTRIDFTVNGAGQPLHSDARVRIRARLFLEGSYYLELDPGSPSAPVVSDGFTLRPDRTTTPVQFFQVLSTFDGAARASLAHTLGVIDRAFAGHDPNGRPIADPGALSLKRTVPQLAPTFADVAVVTRALRGRRSGDMERLLSSAAEVTGTLAASDASLGQLVDGLDQTSAALAASDTALARSIAEGDGLLTAAPPALRAVDRSLPPLTRLAVALDPSLKVSPPIVRRVTGEVRRLAAAVAPGVRGPLLRSLHATFVDLPRLLTTIAAVFPQTRPVTDCLRTRVQPTLMAKLNDGALSSGQPVWQEFVHFLPRLAGASGNFDANGHWIRYEIGAGTQTLDFGNLPGVGSLLGTGTPTASGTTSTIQGASPVWAGDLPASVFRPDVECGSQPLPSFGAVPAAADGHTVHATGDPTAATRDAARRAVRR